MASLSISDCLSPERLERFACGNLSIQESSDVEAHLTTCGNCLETLDGLRIDDPFLCRLSQAGQHAIELPADWQNLIATGGQPEFRANSLAGVPQHTTCSYVPSPVDISWLLTSPGSDDEIGRLDRFRILERLGQGGMGLVLKAFDTTLERLVALKLMLPHLLLRRDLVSRFQQEAKALAAIRSDHVVPVYEVGSVDTPIGSVPYLSMPLLRGETLAERLESGPLPLQQFLEVADQLCSGLVAIHAAKQVHRDIKPGNLWLEYFGFESKDERQTRACTRVIFLDFGLARPESSAGLLTNAGDIMGTPGYMSPEQARGEIAGPRSDLFSLGAVFYEMMTGRRPFDGQTKTSVLRAVLEQAPIDPAAQNSSYPRSVSRLICNLLAKDAERRPKSAEVVLQEIRRIRADVAAEPAVRRLSRHWPAGWRRTVAVSAVLLSGLLAIGVPQVIQVLTPHGTLIIDSLDPDIAVRITKGTTTVIDQSTQRRFDLNVGQYGIELVNAPDGFELSTDQLTIRRGNTPVVKIRRVLRKDAAQPAADQARNAPPAELAKSTEPDKQVVQNAANNRMAILNGVGRWVISGDELVQTELIRRNATIVFGDPEWTDYDFSFEAQRKAGTHGFKALFHHSGLETYYEFATGNYDNSGLDQSCFDHGRWRRFDGMFRLGTLDFDRWYRMELKVRGKKATSYLDGVQMFETEDPQFVRGRCGLGVFDSVSHFRHIVVKHPDGTVLWRGLPVLPPEPGK